MLNSLLEQPTGSGSGRSLSQSLPVTASHCQSLQSPLSHSVISFPGLMDGFDSTTVGRAGIGMRGMHYG